MKDSTINSIVFILGVIALCGAYVNFGPDYVAKVEYRKNLQRDDKSLAWVTILEDKGLANTKAEISEDKERANLPTLSKNYEIGKVYYAYKPGRYFVLKENHSRTNVWFWCCICLAVLCFCLIGVKTREDTTKEGMKEPELKE